MNPFAKVYYRLLAAEIARFSRCFPRARILSRSVETSAFLLSSLDSETTETVASLTELLEQVHSQSLIILDGELNHRSDIVEVLQQLHVTLDRSSRVAAVLYNPYFRFLFWLANLLSLRNAPLPTTFLTRTSLEHILKISGFELVRLRPVCYLPARLGGVGSFMNALLPTIPLLRWLSLATVAILRPLPSTTPRRSISIIVPARNEAGNIVPLLEELSVFSDVTSEVVFVEGHSRDSTWETIQSLDVEQYPFTIRMLQQAGMGKRDAVEAGIRAAGNEIIAIFDADRTVDALEVRTHFDALTDGLGDFVHGNRLLYAMEADAMRFLNLLGNIFFAKALSCVAETAFGDTLCGTKVFFRHDHERMLAWKSNQAGSDAARVADPFGDFDLLLAAAGLGLGVVEVPVRYRARRYGSTNINRIRDGWMLAKVTWFAFKKLRCGPWI